MIEMIPGLPDNVLGFEAKGRISDEDYTATLIPAVEKEFARRGRVRLLYHIGEQCEGVEAAAVWDDTRLGLKHFGSWEKVALVTDVDWIRAAVKIVGMAMPGDVRIFSNQNLDDAVRWISE